MVDDYVLHKVFGKYKKIKGIKKIDDIKIFIATMINCQMILL